METLSVLILLIVVYYYFSNMKINEEPKEKSKDFINRNNSLVYVFNRLLPFYRIDPVNFKNALNNGNDLIKVYESAKKGHLIPNQTIDIAEQLQRNILNYLHSITHSFPTTVIGDYEFQSKVSLVQKVTHDIVNNIKIIYEDYYHQNGPDIYTPPPSIRSGPQGNPSDDNNYSENWNFYA